MRILTVGNMYPPHHQGGYEQDWAAGVAPSVVGAEAAASWADGVGATPGIDSKARVNSESWIATPGCIPWPKTAGAMLARINMAAAEFFIQQTSLYHLP